MLLFVGVTAGDAEMSAGADEALSVVGPGDATGIGDAPKIADLVLVGVPKGGGMLLA